MESPRLPLVTKILIAVGVGTLVGFLVRALTPPPLQILHPREPLSDTPDPEPRIVFVLVPRSALDSAPAPLGAPPAAAREPDHG